jgi:hypothetical protein
MKCHGVGGSGATASAARQGGDGAAEARCAVTNVALLHCVDAASGPWGVIRFDWEVPFVRAMGRPQVLAARHQHTGNARLAASGEFAQ